MKHLHVVVDRLVIETQSPRHVASPPPRPPPPSPEACEHCGQAGRSFIQEALLGPCHALLALPLAVAKPTNRCRVCNEKEEEEEDEPPPLAPILCPPPHVTPCAAWV